MGGDEDEGVKRSERRLPLVDFLEGLELDGSIWSAIPTAVATLPCE